jgi:hypothetical protein
LAAFVVHEKISRGSRTCRRAILQASFRIGRTPETGVPKVPSE